MHIASLNLHACVLSGFSYVCLFVTLWTVARQAPLSMGLSRQEHWRGLLCPPPGDLPDPGIEPVSLISPALAGGFFTTRATIQRSMLYLHFTEENFEFQGSLIQGSFQVDGPAAYPGQRHGWKAAGPSASRTGPLFTVLLLSLGKFKLTLSNLFFGCTMHCFVGSQFPNQGSNPYPLQWKFLTTGQLGKSSPKIDSFPRPGIEPQVEAPSPNRWTSRGFPQINFNLRRMGNTLRSYKPNGEITRDMDINLF